MVCGGYSFELHSTFKSGQTPNKSYIFWICVALWTFWYHINECKTFADRFVVFWNVGSTSICLLAVLGNITVAEYLISMGFQNPWDPLTIMVQENVTKTSK